MSNIVIDNIQATDISNWGCSITGLPEQIVENVRLSNIHIQFKGGGTMEDAERKIPEKPTSYPSSGMFGMLPVYGFFCRHIHNLNLHNISITYDNKDVRPAFYGENIHALTIDDFNAQISPDANAYIVLNNVHYAMIRGCRPSGNSTSFIKVLDKDSKNISLFSNDLSKVQKNIISSNLPEKQITVGENIGKK